MAGFIRCIGTVKDSGETCPQKEKCARFMVKPESWEALMSPPNRGDHCDMFWDLDDVNAYKIRYNAHVPGVPGTE